MNKNNDHYYEKPFFIALGYRLKHFILKLFSVKTLFLIFMGWILKNSFTDWKILSVYLLFASVILGIKEFSKLFGQKIVDNLG
jgi:hypothetical protein